MHSWINDLGYGRSEKEYVFYALLEQAELLDGENEGETFTIYFDAVVADDLEAMPLNGESLSLESEWWRECRSALLGITLTSQQFNNWIGRPEDTEIYGQWFKITLSENPIEKMENTPVQNFMALIDDPIQKYLASIDKLDNNDGKRKALSDCLNGLEATDADLSVDIRAMPTEDIFAVDVIDVGQGNMNVLLAGNNEDALIFYDFGGGVGANSKTWPKHPNIPSRTHAKLIVLSHWDHDHWAGVLRLTKSEFDEICNIPWWVPNQPIGINHAKFAHALFQRGKLRVLHTKKYLPPRRLHAGRNVMIFGCNGAITDRNNSGLAMHLLGPEFRSMLLPGDASYDSIADINWWSYVAMVASHHGGLSSGRPPAAIPPAKLAYSYGKGNAYGHPVSWRVAEHNDAGWRYHAATANRGGGLSRGNIRLEFI